MKTFTKSAISTLFLVCASAAYADTLCIPVDGTVTSETDAACKIHEENAWPNTLPVPVWVESACFALTGKGKARFTGYSGLTSAVAVNSSAQFAATPLVFQPQDDLDTARANLTVFTSNAVLTGKLRNLRGTLYTQDTGVITADGIVGQVLKIVGGTEGFDRATGTIAVAGQEVGGAAFYTGEVCVEQ